MSSILNVQNLSKEFSGFKLNNICFTIPKGSITGLIGINGSGKTTTIKIISGLMKPDRGTMELNGQPYHPVSQKNDKGRLGIVLDGGYFYEELTVPEMKKIYALPYENWDEVVYQELLKELKIPCDRKISQLSKGTKMKFALSLALSHKAELLIMDEPTSGLDPLIRKQFMNILHEWTRRSGGSVLFSTHIISDLEQIADNIIMIHDGKVVLKEKMKNIIENYGIITGDKEALNIEMPIEKSVIKGNTFTAVTKNKKTCLNMNPYLKMKEVKLEELMLYYIGGII